MRKLSLLSFIFVALLFVSCDDQLSSIGLNLKDPNSLLGTSFSDSSTLVAYSVLDTTLNTKNLGNNVLGFVKDPTFGTTKASYYAQYLLSGNSVNFGTNPILDSVVLCIRLSGYFGDTLTSLPISVYELDRLLVADSAYTSTSSVPYKPENLTFDPNYSVRPRPGTRIFVDTTSYDPHLRIKLKNEFGQKFLDNSSSMANDAVFANFFKGLYVTVSDPNGTGSLLYVNLTSTLSNISIYYKKNGIPTKYTLVTSSTALRFNQFEHDYANSASNHFINEVLQRDPNDPLVGTQILYAQPTRGVKTKIIFPNIKETYKDKNVIINRAELVVTNISTDPEYFFMPAMLSLQCMSKTEGLSFLPDDSYFTSSEYFGATYVPSKKEYRIRITKYIQQLILQNEFENYIYLNVSGSGIRANRLILGGTDPIDNNTRLRLEISYTEY